MMDCYLKFCQKYNRKPLNPSTDTLLCYLEHLAEKMKSPKTVSNYTSAIKLLHLLNRAPFDNIEDIEVNLLVRSIPLTKRHISLQKQPLNKTHLQRMCSILDKQGNMGLVIKAALLTGFYGFLRGSNLCPQDIQSYDPSRHFSRGDVNITPTGMFIRLKWAKNMQDSVQPQIIPIAPVKPSQVDPVHTYVRMTSAIPVAPTQPMFMLNTVSPLTIPKLRSVFSLLCQQIGLDPHSYSLHSLRRGGATQAFEQGAKEKEIQRHGGWSSSIFWDYIVPSPSHSSSVCQALSH